MNKANTQVRPNNTRKLRHDLIPIVAMLVIVMALVATLVLGVVAVFFGNVSPSEINSTEERADYLYDKYKNADKVPYDVEIILIAVYKGSETVNLTPRWKGQVEYYVFQDVEKPEEELYLLMDGNYGSIWPSDIEVGDIVRFTAHLDDGIYDVKKYSGLPSNELEKFVGTVDMYTIEKVNETTAGYLLNYRWVGFLISLVILVGAIIVRSATKYYGPPK